VPLVELVELLAGHRGHGSVRVLVETVQGNMRSYKSSFHEALNYDAEAAAWQRLHNDCNSCRTRFDRDVLGRLSGELLKVFEGDSSELLAALINNFPECREGFRKCAHRQLFNYTLRAEFFRNLLEKDEAGLGFTYKDYERFVKESLADYEKQMSTDSLPVQELPPIVAQKPDNGKSKIIDRPVAPVRVGAYCGDIYGRRTAGFLPVSGG